MQWTSSSGALLVDSIATRPSRSSLGYGCCLEDLHFGFIHCSSRSASRVTGVSADEQRTSPSSKTLVRRKETSTELSSSITCDPQFRVKMSSQRSQPHHMRQHIKCVGTDLTVARNPSILLASELTDCLAKRYLNRARCLALFVSGEKVSYVGLPRMWRHELASFREMCR